METRIKKIQYYFYGIGVAYFMLDQVFNQWLNYFYIPPENVNMKPVLSSTFIFIGFFIIRLVDALSDVVVGYLSDNSKAKMGKRSYFMALGGIPLAISMIMFFYPPRLTNQYIVLAYFVLVGSIYFLAYTLVGGPYNAMIADFSKTKEERLNLSTVQSVFRLLFTAIPLIFSGYLIKIFGKGDLVQGIRITVILFSMISCILVYACIYFLKEPTISSNDVKREKISFRKTIKYLKNKESVLYFMGFFLFFSGFNVIRNILTYYVNLVMNEGTGLVTVISAVMFGASAIFFPITNKLAKKYGNRKIMVLNLFTIIIPLLVLSILEPHNKVIIYSMFFIMGAGFSGSAFIFPPAMLSDLCYDISVKEKVNIEGLMFGIQGFFLKLAFLVQAGVTTLGIVYKSNVVDGKKVATIEGVYVCIIASILLLGLSTVFYYINNFEKKE